MFVASTVTVWGGTNAQLTVTTGHAHCLVVAMRVVVTGATGNVGTSLLTALADEPDVHEIVGIARRKPKLSFIKTRFEQADVARDDLRPHFRGADAVVHLAWRIHPSHDLAELTRNNVEGSRRVFDAVVDAGVPALVYASSVGAYIAGPDDGAVDEMWPIGGIVTSTYSRQKAEVERILDEVERASRLRVVRMRPALIFKREAAAHIHRLFLGRLATRAMFDRRVLRALPKINDLCFQCVHSLDVGRAYAAAIVRDAHGPFNLAADPPIGPDALRSLLDNNGRFVIKPAQLRRAVEIAWRLHLQPADPGWVDMAFQLPLLDCRRAETELDWRPRHNALETLEELLDGLRWGDGIDTPPLTPRRAPLRTLRPRTTRGAEA